MPLLRCALRPRRLSRARRNACRAREKTVCNCCGAVCTASSSTLEIADAWCATGIRHRGLCGGRCCRASRPAAEHVAPTSAQIVRVCCAMSHAAACSARTRVDIVHARSRCPPGSAGARCRGCLPTQAALPHHRAWLTRRPATARSWPRRTRICVSHGAGLRDASIPSTDPRGCADSARHRYGIFVSAHIANGPAALCARGRLPPRCAETGRCCCPAPPP